MVFLIDTHARQNGTFYIAVGFIFLAYILHPTVESAYNRIRAYRASVVIKNNGVVDVTKYHAFSELLNVWRGCNAGRAIAVLLLVFYVASWGLELQLALVNISDRPVDMFNRPTPVTVSNGTGVNIWEVLRVSDGKDQKGTLNNFVSTAYTVNGEILSIGKARAVFSTPDYGDPALIGQTTMAEWSTSANHAPASLYYSVEGDTSNLTSLNCNSGDVETELYIEGEDVSWGEVRTCETGPSMVGGHPENIDPPATITLRENGKATYLIVEEESSYPNFLYSVWTVNNTSTTMDTTTISHMFFVGSGFRMAEAIITGIANNVRTGGGCVDLMIDYSNQKEPYNQSKSRARPFGEQPSDDDFVGRLDEVEPYEKGIEADGIALFCLVLIAIISAVGIVGSLFLKSKVGIDVFNRDELIWAILLRDPDGPQESPSSRHMTVRMVSNHIQVDPIGCDERVCFRVLSRPLMVLHDGSGVEGATTGSGTNGVPLVTIRGRLEVIRLAHGRDDFARGFGPQSLSATPSPVELQTLRPQPVSLSPVVPSPAVSSSPGEMVPMSPAYDRNLDQSEAAGQRLLCAPSSFNSTTIIPHHPPWRMSLENIESSTPVQLAGDTNLPQVVPNPPQTPSHITDSCSHETWPTGTALRVPRLLSQLPTLLPPSRTNSEMSERDSPMYIRGSQP